MPKDKSVGSKETRKCKSSSSPDEDVKEWEEARARSLLFDKSMADESMASSHPYSTMNTRRGKSKSTSYGKEVGEARVRFMGSPHRNSSNSPRKCKSRSPPDEDVKEWGEARMRSLPFDKSRASPYPSHSNNARKRKARSPLDEDVKTWGEERICSSPFDRSMASPNPYNSKKERKYKSRSLSEEDVEEWKEERVSSLPFDKSTACPYPCSSNNMRKCKPRSPPNQDVKEREEARVCSLPFDKCMTSPCPYSSSNPRECKSRNPSYEDVKEWEEERIHSLPSDAYSTYPCPYSSKKTRPYKSKSPSEEDVKEWEEARCPICMEHPHNAVLLQCERMGCRPYMCDTSCRHSNCLDQFRKSSTSNLSTEEPEEVEPKLVCPLCRGCINGWVVVKPAREYMNSKQRSCSCETCDFSGTYSELREHAKSKHPSVKPAEVDPSRQHEWTRFVREREFEDAFGSVQLVITLVMIQPSVPGFFVCEIYTNIS